MIYARGFIQPVQYEPGRLYADLVRILRPGWGVADGSVAGLWAAVMTGRSKGPDLPAEFTRATHTALQPRPA